MAIANTPDLTIPEHVAARWRNERPDLDHGGLELVLRFRAIAMVIDHENARIARTKGIETEDVLLLSALRRRGPEFCLRPTDIGGILNITSGTVTVRIERLIRRGLAEREKDPTDGRSFLIRLSPKGRSVIDDVITHMAQLSSHVIAESELGTVGVATLKECLHRFETGWQRVIPEDEYPLNKG